MDKEQLLELLSSIRKKLADQGRIVDARLLEKEKQILKLLQEPEQWQDTTRTVRSTPKRENRQS